MDGTDSRYKYYFVLKNNQPSINQTMDGDDFHCVPMKELTKELADMRFSSNMIKAAEIALNNPKIRTYLIME